MLLRMEKYCSSSILKKSFPRVLKLPFLLISTIKKGKNVILWMKHFCIFALIYCTVINRFAPRPPPDMKKVKGRIKRYVFYHVNVQI